MNITASYAQTNAACEMYIRKRITFPLLTGLVLLLFLL